MFGLRTEKLMRKEVSGYKSESKQCCVVSVNNGAAIFYSTYDFIHGVISINKYANYDYNNWCNTYMDFICWSNLRTEKQYVEF